MSRFILTLEASTDLVVGAAPLLDIRIGSTTVSSASITAQTGVGSNLLVFTIDYTGSFPASLRFRFNGGSGDGDETVTIESVQINGQSLNTATDLTGTMLAQGAQVQMTSTSAQDHLFGRVEPTLADLGTPTHSGTGGDDSDLNGSDNDDVIDAGAGNDLVRGMLGDDAIYGDAGNDTIYGEDGNDIIAAGAGDDRVFGNDGNDLIYGEADIDRLFGGAGDDVLNGGTGNDILIAGIGNDILYGGDGADRLIGQRGTNSLYGDAGDDMIIGGSDDDTVWGGDDNDMINGGRGNDTLNGDDGDDVIRGGDGTDTIDGGLGLDEIYGGDGVDTIDGGDGDDQIFGGAGDDIIDGENDNDTLVGGDGADTINGGAGNDVLHGSGLDSYEISAILQNNAGVIFSEVTNSFYQFVSGPVSWTAAETAAQAATLVNGGGIGGHMVTVTSAAENAIIYQLGNDNGTTNAIGAAGNRIWLGASDNVTDQDWYWMDGPEAGLQFSTGSTPENNFYENWGTGQPNNSGGAQIYATIWYNGGANDDVWDDRNASDGHNYVIEWDAGSLSDDNAIDTLNGGAGNDLIYGWGGADILRGGDNDDQLFGGDGDDNMNGQNDNDMLAGGDGNDIADGGNGNDIIYGQNGDDNLDGDAGVDVVYGDAGNDIVDGGDGDDTLYGGVGDDNMDGDNDNDTLYGDAGNDLIDGGNGNDTLFGGTDNDDLNGQDGSDILWGEDGVDNLNGGNGNDTLHGGDGNDIVDGGADDDILNGNDGDDNMDGDAGIDTVNGDAGNDLIDGGDGDDTLNGGADDDDLNGQNDNDILNGDDGNDNLDGGEGNDTLNGGNDDDILEGDNGDDILDGGAGTDTAYYLTAGSAVTVDLSILVAQNTIGAGTDTLSNIENLTGSNHNDTLTGDAGVNTINGQNGNDSIRGGLGADILNGGSGNDDFYVSGAESLGDFFNGGNNTDRVHLLADSNFDMATTFSSLNSIETNGFNIIALANGGFDLTGQTVNGGGELHGDATGAETITGSNSNDTIRGFAGADILNGGNGVDTIYGGDDVDTINGGNGDDEIYGGAGADILNGGNNNDNFYISGTESEGDQFDGGGNTDEIFLLADSYFNNATSLTSIEDIENGGFNLIATLNEGFDLSNLTFTGAGELHGQGGNETIVGSNSNDTMRGGGGNDTLSGDDGNDTIYGDAGVDTINGNNGTDFIYGGAGADILNGGTGNDDFFISGTDSLGDQYDGGGNTDEIHLQADSYFNLANTFTSIEDIESGGFTIYADTGTGFNLTGMTITGGSDLRGQGGNETMTGSNSVDTMRGEAGDDIISGGNSNDTIYGDAIIENITIVNPSFEDPVLADGAFIDGGATGWTNGGVWNPQAIDFTGEIVPDGTQTGYEYGGSTMSQTLTDTLAADTLYTFTMEVGNALTAPSFPTYDIRLMAGATTIGSETSVTPVAGGWEEVHFTVDSAAYTAAIGQTLRIEIEVFGLGTEWLDFDDLILTAYNYNGAGNDTLNGDAGTDTLYGGNGTDTLNGGAGNDELYGGAGADIINGGDNNDNIYIAGTDSRGDTYDGGAGGDEIFLLADVYFNSANSFTSIEDIESRGNIINIDSGATVDLSSMSITGGSDIRGTTGNETITGSTVGDTIRGDSGNDVINGHTGSDIIYGGAGADTMDGGTGNDDFYIAGTDSLGDQYTGGTGTDEIRMTADVYFNLANTFTTVETIISGGFIIYADTGTGFDLTGMAISGGSDLRGQGGVETITGSNSADDITGGAGADIMAGGNGNDDFNIAGTDSRGDQYDGGAGTDEIWMTADVYFNSANVFTSIEDIESGGNTINIDSGATVSFAGMSISGGSNIVAAAGNETITGSTSADTITAGAGNDIISGGNSADTIYGDTGTDTINGDAGDDTIYGGADADVLNGGDGNDNFYAGGTETRGDTYDGGNNSDDLFLTADAYFNTATTFTNMERIVFGGFIINVDSGSTINLAGMTANGASNIVAAAGNETITGTESNDDITGGAGTDIMNGGGGNDDFNVGGTDGLNDTFNGGAGTDEIHLTAAATFGTTTTFTSIEDIETAGNTINISSGSTIDFTGMTITGGSNIVGAAGIETITGSESADDITGGAGADIMAGGNGNDDFNVGGATDALGDTYDGGAGSDDIWLTADTTFNSANVFTSIERIVFGGFDIDIASGATVDFTGMTRNGAGEIVATTGNETVSGTEGGDTIRGDSGTDTLYGNDGNDFIYGGADDDIIYGGDGRDELYGDGGADTFVLENATAFNDIERLRDFSTTDSDVLDIQDILSGVYTFGVDDLTLFVQITDSGANSLVNIDTTGSGTFGAGTQVATLYGITGLTDEVGLETAGTLVTN